jgi:diguanylate cyclase (GGDEF)-like protein
MARGRAEETPVALPVEVERAARLAAVPPHLSATLRRLQRPLSLSLVLPEGSAHELPVGARQLLKLALRGDGLSLQSVATGPMLALELAIADKKRRLAVDELSVELRAILPRILLDLFGPSDVARVLDQLSFSSSSLATLRKVTSRMLATSDQALAQRLLLRGLTAGFGLGFHRAALFLRASDRLVGAWAEGPADEAEAHRVWESLELEDVDVERTLDGASDPTPGPLARTVQRMELREDDPWLARAFSAAGALLFEPSDRGPFDQLDVRTPFVVAALRARGAPFGLVFADDRYGGPIAEERLQHLDVFIDQAALVIDNLRLFERALGLSRTDALTGLANRRELDERFALLADRARRSVSPLSLLIADVDHFKVENDTRGHEAGDDLLKRVARLLERTTRAGDSLARYGGDEFVVLLPDLDRQGLAAVLSRIDREARAGGISVSLGGATFPAHCDDPKGLFAVADAALYRSKQAGRSCAHLAEERLVPAG